MQYTHTKAVEKLINDGMTIDQVREALPMLDISVYKSGEIDACTWNRREENAFQQAYAKLTAPPTPTTADGQPLATERQVRYIMDLLDRTDGGQGSWYSGPTTLKGVRAMSRSAASSYISALRGE